VSICQRKNNEDAFKLTISEGSPNQIAFSRELLAKDDHPAQISRISVPSLRGGMAQILSFVQWGEIALIKKQGYKPRLIDT